MDFLELAKKRYSAREYSPKEVEQEKLEYILECARLAPSAVNHQPWRFIVVKSDEARKAVQQLSARMVCTSPALHCRLCKDFRGMGAGMRCQKPCRHRYGHRRGAHLSGSHRTGIGQLLGLQFRRVATQRQPPFVL